MNQIAAGVADVVCRADAVEEVLDRPIEIDATNPAYPQLKDQVVETLR